MGPVPRDHTVILMGWTKELSIAAQAEVVWSRKNFQPVSLLHYLFISYSPFLPFLCVRLYYTLGFTVAVFMRAYA
jgi:hypothetical protein